jgi:hypothetical protein
MTRILIPLLGAILAACTPKSDEPYNRGAIPPALAAEAARLCPAGWTLVETAGADAAVAVWAVRCRP